MRAQDPSKEADETLVLPPEGDVEGYGQVENPLAAAINSLPSSHTTQTSHVSVAMHRLRYETLM